jgi:HD-like signal output (HDOD) protein
MPKCNLFIPETHQIFATDQIVNLLQIDWNFPNELEKALGHTESMNLNQC